MGGLRADNGQDSIILSWSPPFSLNVTGVDPDIWYTVLISNVTDGDNPIDVSCADCHSLTQSNYVFTSADPSPCHKYNFTIIPENEVGEGSSSEPVIGYFTTGNILTSCSFKVLNFVHIQIHLVLTAQE